MNLTCSIKNCNNLSIAYIQLPLEKFFICGVHIKDAYKYSDARRNEMRMEIEGRKKMSNPCYRLYKEEEQPITEDSSMLSTLSRIKE